MLIENLYTLDSFINQDNKAIATITINAAHKIFEGHFPGQPIVPGVCQLQFVKELLERATGRKLFLSQVAICKFLQMIDPVKTNLLIVTLDYNVNDNIVSCHALIKSGETTFLKLNSIFTIAA